MSRSRPHRILVVDDQIAVAEVVRDTLTEIGYSVVLAATAAEALNQVPHDAPDLVLLDLGLPDMVGLDVLDRLRARWPTIPVIILSGTEDPVLAQAALVRGAADYITKPFNLERLRHVVEVVLTMRT